MLFDNGSIQLLAQFLSNKTIEPLNGSVLHFCCFIPRTKNFEFNIYHSRLGCWCSLDLRSVRTNPTLSSFAIASFVRSFPLKANWSGGINRLKWMGTSIKEKLHSSSLLLILRSYSFSSSTIRVGIRKVNSLTFTSTFITFVYSWWLIVYDVIYLLWIISKKHGFLDLFLCQKRVLNSRFWFWNSDIIAHWIYVMRDVHLKIHILFAYRWLWSSGSPDPSMGQKLWEALNGCKGSILRQKFCSSTLSIRWTCFISRVSKQEALSWLIESWRVSYAPLRGRESALIEVFWVENSVALKKRNCTHGAVIKKVYLDCWLFTSYI